MKQFMTWLLGIVSLGFLGATARYVNDLGKKKQDFSIKRWLIDVFLGVFVAVITGFICEYLNAPNMLTYATVAVSAIASKEILDNVPQAFIKVMNKLSDKIK